MAQTNHPSDSASDMTSSARPYAIQRELPHFTPPSSLLHFWKLPRELQHRILLAACGPPTQPRNTNAGRSIDDTTTIVHLSKTSRFFYAQVMPLLYANVRITRPSTLLSFSNTLLARPSLGQMVRRLHIGPDEALPEHWYPISDSDCGVEEHLLFRLNLGGGSAKKPGSWLGGSSYEYHYEEYEGDDPESNAILRAIRRAENRLDVTLKHQGRDNAGEPLNSNAWHIRILELQAAMELYYLEVKRRETSAGQHSSKTKSSKSTKPPTAPPPAYPHLAIESSGTQSWGKKISSNSSRQDVFRITRRQIQERMSSPGAPADSFSHPLLFARSRLDWSAAGPDGLTHHGDNSSSFSSQHLERVTDVFSGSHFSLEPTLDQAKGVVEMPWTREADPLNLGGSSIATVGGCLALARCLLSLTPNVVSLSLTGVFEVILAGELASCQQPLESLTLGPAEPGWARELHLGKAGLKGLRRLRIGGNILVDSEIASIVGRNGNLARLSTLQWSMAEECSDEDGIGDPVEIVQQLLALKTSTAAGPATNSSSPTEPQRKRLKTAQDLSPNGSSLQDEKSSLRHLRARQRQPGKRASLCTAFGIA